MKLFNKFKKNKNRHEQIRREKHMMNSLTETERDFVVLLNDGMRTESRLRRMGFDPETLTKQLERKGYKIYKSCGVNPYYLIYKEAK